MNLNNLADSIRNLFNQGSNAIQQNVVKPAQQAIYNFGVDNPKTNAQFLNIQKSIQQNTTNAVKFVQNQPVFNAPSIGLFQLPQQQPQQFQSPTIKDLMNLAPSLWQVPLRKAEQIRATSINPNFPTQYPQGNVGKFLFGNEPIQNFPSQIKQTYQGGVDLGVPKPLSAGFAPLAVAGISVLDLMPVTGGAKKAVAQEAISIASKSRTPVEFLSLLGKAKPETSKLVEDVIKNKKIAINSVEDFFNAVKKQPELRQNVKIGSYSNVKEIDNPLVLGQDWQKAERSRMGTNEPLPWESTGQILNKQITEQSLGNSLPEQVFKNLIEKDKGIDVKTKVNIFDNFFRTPDRVLQKIGLGEQATSLRKAFSTYQQELPVEIDKITAWSKRVSNEENKALFRYLDGQTNLKSLSPEAQKVAEEIKSYFKTWAERLELPEDKRITSYITHIFEKDFITKEFDPEISALIRDKVAGSVYDPFVQQRMGKQGYIEDTWKALDAYVKRATRKVNLDPALTKIKDASLNFEDSQYNYVKNYIDRVNMRPTDIENMVDNTIKQVFGYRLGQRPTIGLSQGVRQMVYRGTLGLNPASALKNLTQGANTYARLGEKYTVIGYTNFVKNFIQKSDELQRVGVLKNDFIEDRVINATKKFWENADKGLFSFFEMAEKINRGSAYFGAKAKGLSLGKTEQEAIDYALKVVRDTQFTFGSIDTPPILQSPINKVLFQFQSFNLKQAEFLLEMMKNKDFAGLFRFSLASTAMFFAVGKAIGMSPEDFVPFSGVATGRTKLGITPPIKLAQDLMGTAFNSRDQYGQQPTFQDRLETLGKDLVPFVPAGVQMKKTFGGISDVNRGYAQTSSGNVKYPVDQGTGNLIKGAILGGSNLPEAQQYRANDQRPLSENQTNLYKESSDKLSTYRTIQEARKESDMIDKIKEEVKDTGSTLSDNKLVYNDNGTVRTIDLNEPSKGQGIDSYINEDWNISKALQVWKAKDQLSEEQVSQAFKQLGVEAPDVRYAYLASHNTDISTRYIIDKSETHEELLKNLLSGRVVGISGEQFANNGVIDNLFEKGLITKNEQTILKKIKIDKNGKSLILPKTSKAKSVRIATVKTKKLPTIKLSSSRNSVKIISLKPPKLKKTKTRNLKNLSKGIFKV